MHSAPIMYAYLIRRQKAPAAGASLLACARCLRLPPPCCAQVYQGLVKNGSADLNPQRVQVVLSHSQGVVKMTTPYQLNKHKK